MVEQKSEYTQKARVWVAFKRFIRVFLPLVVIILTTKELDLPEWLIALAPIITALDKWFRDYINVPNGE